MIFDLRLDLQLAASHRDDYYEASPEEGESSWLRYRGCRRCGERCDAGQRLTGDVLRGKREGGGTGGADERTRSCKEAITGYIQTGAAAAASHRSVVDIAGVIGGHGGEGCFAAREWSQDGTRT